MFLMSANAGSVPTEFPYFPPKHKSKHKQGGGGEEALGGALQQDKGRLAGVDVVAVVPDLDYFAVAEPENVYDRDVFIAAQNFHPPDVGFEVPLPAGRDEVSFRYLVIDRAGHGAAFPE